METSSRLFLFFEKALYEVIASGFQYILIDPSLTYKYNPEIYLIFSGSGNSISTSLSV